MKHFAIVNLKDISQISLVSYNTGMIPPEHPDFKMIELDKYPEQGIDQLYFKDEVLKERPKAPSQNHKWDVATETYVEDVEGVREKLLEQLKIAFRFGDRNLKAMFRGTWYNAAWDAEVNLLVAIQTNSFPQEWRGLDNTEKVVTQEEAVVLLNKVREARLNYKKQYWQIKDLIIKATSLNDFPMTAVQEFVAAHRVNTPNKRR